MASGLAHGHKVSQSTISIVPAGCGLLIGTLARVEDKGKAIIARFTRGEPYLFQRAERCNRLKKPRLIRVSLASIREWGGAQRLEKRST